MGLVAINALFLEKGDIALMARQRSPNVKQATTYLSSPYE